LQKVLIDYLKGLENKDCKVDIICDFNMGSDVPTYIGEIPNNMNFRYVKSEKISKLIYYFRTLGKKNKIFNIFLYLLMIVFDFYYYHTKVKKIVKDGKYDWTISFYQFLPAYLTSIKNCKHIIWLHGSIEHFFGGIKNLFIKSYEKKLDKYDFVVTIADEMREQLIEFYPYFSREKIQRIYNPFDFIEITNKSNDYSSLNQEEKELLKDEYICTVSRVDEGQKDITTLINAYEDLWKNKKIVDKLYIIGNGSSKKELERLVKEKKLEAQILFLGNKINPFIWMKHSKLFILSSKYEGLPTVLIEAMSCNTFTISSNCKTGPKEILCDSKCGDLFEVGNVEELSDKISFALSNENYRNQKIQLAKERINEFESVKSIENLLTLFRMESEFYF
ncbi:MAG: glycosyltransferase, partial [Campylobacterales bacterium]|nr:glycosyltransferase [Campylobacterales bacterium]